MPLPSAQTESARELRRSFFCDLCQKGYARVNELEPHENSYHHQHKKRLKEMKAMTRQPPGGSRRKAEKSDMVSVNLQSDTQRLGLARQNRGGEASRPVGWPVPAVQAVEKGPAKEKEVKKDTEEEERWEDRPLAWEELDEAGGMVDLDAMRPGSLRNTVDASRELVEKREDAEFYNDIWARVEEMRSGWSVK